eukprot:15467199-Alexandrium_andersonii.AAC.1
MASRHVQALGLAATLAALLALAALGGALGRSRINCRLGLIGVAEGVVPGEVAEPAAGPPAKVRVPTGHLVRNGAAH